MAESNNPYLKGLNYAEDGNGIIGPPPVRVIKRRLDKTKKWRDAHNAKGIVDLDDNVSLRTTKLDEAINTLTDKISTLATKHDLAGSRAQQDRISDRIAKATARKNKLLTKRSNAKQKWLETKGQLEEAVTELHDIFIAMVTQLDLWDYFGLLP